MDETNKDAALDAIHEEAIKLLNFGLTQEAEDIARECYALWVSNGIIRCNIKQAKATKCSAATVSGNRS